MIFGLLDDLNHCDFALRVDAYTADDKICCSLVEAAMYHGLELWYEAAHDVIRDDDPDFTKEEIAAFYDLGYAEPTSLLLDKRHIPHSIEDLEFDNNGNPVCDIVVEY